MSKVTMQDIADELGISRVTVWKVFNNHSGVSEAIRESVLQKAKELGYSKFMQEPASIPNDPQEDKTVSLIVSRPDSSTFWTNIIHRLAQELQPIILTFFILMCHPPIHLLIPFPLL